MAAAPGTSAPGRDAGRPPRLDGSPPVVIRRVRLVPLRGVSAPEGEVDLRLANGRVEAVAPRLAPEPGDRVLDAEGRWVLPGLWDAHVHLGQWALTRARLDLAGTRSPEAALARLVEDLERRDRAGDRDGLVVTAGHRLASWDRTPTVAELDAAVGERPVVLVSGDVHNGWCSSAALRLLGVPASVSSGPGGPLEEDDWFPVMARLGALERGDDAAALTAYREAADAAAARGVVGIGDMEMEAGWREWPDRVSAGVTALRVRTAVYRDRLDEVLAAGVRSGDVLDAGGLVTMGPLKVISDGSLGTRTAWCHDPYPPAPAVPGEPPGDFAANRQVRDGLAGDFAANRQVRDRPGSRGRQNVPLADLTALLRRSYAGGLTAAVHAIGDAAVADALAAIEAAGVAGSLEHAQLVDLDDLPRMARLGVVASVQPAHLVDDRDLTDALWADRAGRAYAFRSMLDAGVALALGSDAPVAPLDPWLAIAAAVHRSGDERDPWHPEQTLTVDEALAASTDGQGTVAVGSRADLVLVDDDPLGRDLPGGAGDGAGDGARDGAALARRLGGIRVAATFLAGRPTHVAI